MPAVAVTSRNILLQLDQQYSLALVHIINSEPTCPCITSFTLSAKQRRKYNPFMTSFCMTQPGVELYFELPFQAYDLHKYTTEAVKNASGVL